VVFLNTATLGALESADFENPPIDANDAKEKKQ
jgi:hypothetical protein